jgi:hypothetical protein
MCKSMLANRNFEAGGEMHARHGLPGPFPNRVRVHTPQPPAESEIISATCLMMTCPEINPLALAVATMDLQTHALESALHRADESFTSEPPEKTPRRSFRRKLPSTNSYSQQIAIFGSPYNRRSRYHKPNCPHVCFRLMVPGSGRLVFAKMEFANALKLKPAYCCKKK